MVSRYAAPLRDLAAGRVRDYQHRLRRLDERGWQRYGILLDTAFRLAANRRFRTGQDRAPIIRFVATVRERYDRTGYDLDPRLAESVLWATLDGRPAPEPDQPSTITAQTLLLIGLLDDEGLSPAELDRFLTTAETETGTRTDSGTDSGTDIEAEPDRETRTPPPRHGSSDDHPG